MAANCLKHEGKGRCCCNCAHRATIFKHPRNAGAGNGRVQAIFMEGGHGICEMHGFANAAGPLIPVVATAYGLPGGAAIERYVQRDDSVRWAVRRDGYCLNLEGSYEPEPTPSGRDDAFLARCRFDSAERAYATWFQSAAMGQAQNISVAGPARRILPQGTET